MRKIYKYTLKLEGKQTVEMPAESNILSVGIQTVKGGFSSTLILSENITI